jgi:tryptophanyl-tRNA synthetase
MKPRIFSGSQPTGVIHLGNYFGAIKNWVQMQNDYDAFFCIVDLHSLTVYMKPQERQRHILDLIKLYLAVGLDPKKATIFIQSHVKQHAELSWVLNTVTPIAELERMTQFKDKAKQHKENINAGLFTYPVLMAADILLYNTQVVPVGEDQKQHVELARIIAKKFNKIYGETFIVPKSFVPQIGARLMGLDDASKKMSKSATSENNFIAITDDLKLVEKKIMRAVTDSDNKIYFDQEKKPEISNLLAIYSLVTDKKIENIVKEYEGKGYGDFKKGLAQAVVNFLKPIQNKIKSISDKQALKIVEDGAKKANKIADGKMQEVKKKIGLI